MVRLALPLMLAATPLAAQDADLAAVIADLEARLSLTEPVEVDGLLFQSITFTAVPATSGCDLALDMVFGADGATSTARMTGSTADLDPATLGVEDYGPLALVVTTVNEAPVLEAEIVVVPGFEYYEDMAAAIAENAIDGTCTEAGCNMPSMESEFGVPFPPSVDEDDIAGLSGDFGTMMELCNAG